MKKYTGFTKLFMILAALAVCFIGLRPDEAMAAGMAVSHMAPHSIDGPMAKLLAVCVPAVGLIINLDTLAAIFKGFNTLFNQAFSGVTPQWMQVAMKVPSSTAENLYAWLGSFPTMREWVGDRQIKNLKTHDYTIKNKDYEVTIGVPRNNITDDTIGVFNPIVSELGRSAATHVDELIFSLMGNADAVICYDGQFFFDTDHPVGDGVVSNKLAGAAAAWYLLDITRAVKPFIFQEREAPKFVQKTDPGSSDHVFNTKEYVYGVDDRKNVGVGLWQLALMSEAVLDATAYAAARAAMMEFKDDSGKPLGIMPTLLVVPPSLEAAALTLLKAEKAANGATNIYLNSADLLVSPWLA